MSSLSLVIALALALQGSLCSPICTESNTTAAPAAETSATTLPCHETDDTGSPERPDSRGCGHDCEGCGLFAQGFSGTAKPAVPAAPALVLLRIPGLRIDEPQRPHIDLRRRPSVPKPSLPILHSTLLL